MAVITQPTSPRLLPELLRDPRVEPAVRPGGITLLEAPRPTRDCDCAPKAAPDGATPDLTDRVAAYLKVRFEPITPLGPPPGDRRILAEAGVDLKQFATRPPGVTPLGRSAMIKPLMVPFRSPRAPEVLRAIWNRLSLLYAMPSGIAPLADFGRLTGGKGSQNATATLPTLAWAGFSDAIAATAVDNVFPAPVTVGVPNVITACRCDSPKTRVSRKVGGG